MTAVVNGFETLASGQAPEQGARQENVLLKWRSGLAFADICRNSVTAGEEFGLAQRKRASNERRARWGNGPGRSGLGR
jgi:hypothetical protein